MTMFVSSCSRPSDYSLLAHRSQTAAPKTLLEVGGHKLNVRDPARRHPGPEPRSIKQIVAELRALLE